MDKIQLEELALSLGADFFGVADLEPFRGSVTLPSNLLDAYTRAVSLGVALSRGIFEQIVDRPTPHYAHHYTKANELLDHVALRLTKTLQRQGHRALPIPASQVLDQDRWLGAISHKAVARMAGIGWQGKSLLLVNPKVGPRVRLVTILTDLDLEPNQPLPNGCGKCEECAKACPAGAIKATPFGDGYEDRSAAWDADACTGKLKRDFNDLPNVTPWICGLCIKACPIGRANKAY